MESKLSSGRLKSRSELSACIIMYYNLLISLAALNNLNSRQALINGIQCLRSVDVGT